MAEKTLSLQEAFEQGLADEVPDEAMACPKGGQHDFLGEVKNAPDMSHGGATCSKCGEFPALAFMQRCLRKRRIGTLADLERSLERAWDAAHPKSIFDRSRSIHETEVATLFVEMAKWVAIRRAMHDAGLVRVTVSRKALMSLRAALAQKHPQLRDEDEHTALRLLAADLEDVLKDTL
jgi:hypothetical protein